MRKILNKYFSKLKFKVEIGGFPNEGIDLDNLCQFIDADQSVDIDLYKEAGILVVRNIFKQSKLF